VEVFGAVSALQSVAVIQAAMQGETLVVTAGGPVSHSADAGPGGLTGALSRWGEAFVAGAGVAAGDLREIPPVWCSWYQYYGAVTAEDILLNLTAMDDCGMPVGVVQTLIPADGDKIIAHHDLAPWNLIIGEWHWAFIDWDTAAPGTRLWDLAYAMHGFSR